MKNIGALLIFMLLGAAAARTAQAADDALPPTDALPGMETLIPPRSTLGEPTMVGDGPYGDGYLEPIPQGDLQGLAHPLAGDVDHGYFDRYPAVLESTGSWLRRGFWFAEIDAMIINRQFNRSRTLLIYEGSNLTGNQIFNTIHSNELVIYPNEPGADALPRLKLGRFWFRDGKNRDHTTELIWYGGGEWSQQSRLQARTLPGLRVPTPIDRGAAYSSTLSNAGNLIFLNDGNLSFDGARNSVYQYTGYLDSVEFNYQVKQRMDRDRMELQPDGEWVRKATSSRTAAFLAGVRYINVRDNLVWTASGIPDPNNGFARDVDGFYYVATDNDLLGTQLGASMAFETDRWSITGQAKIGGYINAVDMNSTFAVGDLNSGTANADTDNLSFVGDFQLLGKWHFRPNMSIRASAEILMIESVAVAPDNLNFIPGGSPAIAAGSENVFMGTSIGFESYW